MDDLWVTYKDKGLIQKTVPLGSLKDDNQRHKDLKKEFVNIISEFINEYVERMGTCEYANVSHWDELEKGRIIKGMNEFEVRLLKGAPRNVSENGDKTKWRYSNSNVIVLTDGIVTSIVE